MSDLSDAESRMKKSLSVLHESFAGIRTGRASTAALAPIKVDAYGQQMPLTQLASVSVADARLLLVKVWDNAMVAAVEKALRESDLGLNPMTDGQTIRLPLPALSQERRQELVKLAAKYAEQARISVRNIRRDALDKIKKTAQDNHASDDDIHQLGQQLQKLTDKVIHDINDSLARKEHDIMQP